MVSQPPPEPIDPVEDHGREQGHKRRSDERVSNAAMMLQQVPTIAEDSYDDI
jgi:hypothetical protein